MKARLDCFWDRNKMNYGQAVTNILTEWGRLIDVLMAKDPQGMVVMPWSDTDYGRAPLTKKSTKPVTKEMSQGNMPMNSSYPNDRELSL
jgi:hypothetical protein